MYSIEKIKLLYSKSFRVILLISKVDFSIKGGIADLIDKLELAKISNKEISNDEILERLKELIPMIRPNLEKFDKSKYPSFDSGVFPKTEIKSNVKYNSITGKIIYKEE